MTRAEGWYWVRRVPEENWQPAYWGRSQQYPGEYRWRLATYLEVHVGRLHRIGERIRAPLP